MTALRFLAAEAWHELPGLLTRSGSHVAEAFGALDAPAASVAVTTEGRSRCLDVETPDGRLRPLRASEIPRRTPCRCGRGGA